MITGKLMGGLGNQLFIMAACYGYSKKHNLKCVIHKPSISYRTPNTEHYENTIFRNFDKVDDKITNIFNEPDKYALLYLNIPKMLGSLNMIYGYFQNEKYFDFCKDEFIGKLSLSFKPLLKNTCFIHVRRGDYLKVPLHCIDLSKYYVNAINYVQLMYKDVKFLVFSDDISWCKSQYIFKNCMFYENDNEVESLMMMASCEIGGICANSSFSWWGSYLNPNKNKTVIFPNRWFVGDMRLDERQAFVGDMRLDERQAFNDPSFIVEIGYMGSIVLPIDRIIPKMKFKVFSSFCSSTDAMNAYNNVCQISDNNLIEFVHTDNYTHAIILNNAMPGLSISKDKVLGLSFEPYIFQHNIVGSDQFVDYAKNNIGCYCIGATGNLSDPFKSHYTYQWHKWQRPYEFKEYDKSNRMSIVLSDKKMTKSHEYRHQLVQAILKTDLDIHMWGRGCRLHGNDKRIKGSFKDEEPYESYEYTIAIENNPEDYNITEKFTDAIGYGCKVIYYGAPKINDVFGSRCCIKLLGNLELDMEIIKKVYHNGVDMDTSNVKHELFHRKGYLPYFLYHHFNKDVKIV